VDDLKVGDIVRYGRIPSISARGIITKIETKITKGRPNPRTYAVVFWFRLRECLAVNADWLTKVEVEGV
tara:strand:- start:129 stop:335 length:207 start_codon:yes stop_codon:yes gene_type:complete